MMSLGRRDDGAKVERGKWIRGKGTKLVWNSFKESSNRREAVIDETTWAIRRSRLVKLGEVISRFLQMS